MSSTVLGGITKAEFLKKYWQKKPLLIRNALNKYANLVSKQELQNLAYSEDVQSRLVSFSKGQWQLSYGPFTRRDFTKLPDRWTLLVQSVNHYLPEAQALLKHFNFIPHSRLDDLMISYAPDGGGVGPHFDSYDVFLLQGSGQRLWQIAKQKDQSLVADAPLRILKHFKPEQEWVLEQGDMLYLPPNYAHNGVAIGECMTYSIGFRAPSHQELAQEFLMYMMDQCRLDGMYADPNLKLSKHPGLISDEMILQVLGVLKKLQWNKKIVGDFLGQYLTTPKSPIFLEPPEVPLTQNIFLKQALKKGIGLSPKSQLLFTRDKFYLNGELCSVGAKSKVFLQKLADNREAELNALLVKNLGDELYQWYLDGSVVIR